MTTELEQAARKLLEVAGRDYDNIHTLQVPGHLMKGLERALRNDPDQIALDILADCVQPGRTKAILQSRIAQAIREEREGRS